jgi:hypothetical protein
MNNWPTRTQFAPKAQQHIPHVEIGEPSAEMKTDVYNCVACGKDYRRVAIRNHRHPEEKTLLCFDCAKARQNGAADTERL